MKTKTALAALWLASVPIYQANAQEQYKQDSTTIVETIAKKSWHVLERIVETGTEYLVKKVQEAELEDKIENSTSYAAPDKKTADLLAYLGLHQAKAADITSVVGNKATANMRFSYSLDNLAFVEQYEFALKDGQIDSIAGKGNGWIELAEKSYPKEEGFRILHLYDEIIRTWDKAKQDYEKENPGSKFVYDRKGISVQGNSAISDIHYLMLDKFGNVTDQKEYDTSIEYKFSDGKWQFDDTAFYQLMKNPSKPEIEFLDQLYNAGKSALSTLKAWWRGE